MSVERFAVQLSFKGKTVTIEASVQTTADDLLETAKEALLESQDTITINEEESIKLLWKGKRLQGEGRVFALPPKKIAKIMVLATPSTAVQELNSKRSDPTIRGFDQERIVPNKAQNELFWGPTTSQDKNYKFCRFEACTTQSFGHRPVESTPHDFAARALLEKLATDPGIVSILKERELVVGALGEMDPIDDRLMQKKQQQGACLLGYNTNGGARIDLKLRTDDLKGFRPYPQLAATLIHELSHNWCGEHDLLFWTNYGQMRVEYLYTHTLLNSTVVNGQTTAQIASLPVSCKNANDVFEFVMQELAQEMAQHGLHPNMIQSAISERCDELEQSRGTTLGGGDSGSTRKNHNTASPREMALAAAERRAREQNGDKDNEGKAAFKEEKHSK